MPSYGGLYITGNSTAFYVPHAAAKYTTGWVAFAKGRGDLTVTESATNSRLTVKPGVYLVTLHMTIETEVVSGTSGDSVGIITVGIRKDQSQVTGLKAKLDSQAADRPHNVNIVGLVEVDSTDSGQLEVYVDATDASGNDVVVSEAQFCAVLMH